MFLFILYRDYILHSRVRFGPSAALVNYTTTWGSVSLSQEEVHKCRMVYIYFLLLVPFVILYYSIVRVRGMNILLVLIHVRTTAFIIRFGARLLGIYQQFGCKINMMHWQRQILPSRLSEKERDARSYNRRINYIHMNYIQRGHKFHSMRSTRSILVSRDSRL